MIKLASKESIVLHIDSLNGVESTPDYILEFVCEPLTHNFAFDYTQTKGAAKHTIELKYTTMTPYNQKEEAKEIAA